MSSVKRSKADKKVSKEDDKKIVVSFTSDTDDDDRSTSSSSRSSSSDNESPAKQVLATPASATIVKPPAAKEVTSSSDDAETVKTVQQPSPVTSPTTDQQPSQESVTSSGDQEKPTKKTPKTKVKETVKSTSDVNENGTASIVSEKLMETDSKEPAAPEPKIKKKKSLKSELSTKNGSLQPNNAVGDDHTQANENGNDIKKTKTVKKSTKSLNNIDNGDIDPTKVIQTKNDTETINKSVDSKLESDDAKLEDKTQIPTIGDESTPKSVKKSTKKSTKTSAATVNGDTDKPASLENDSGKVIEKKGSKKSKEENEDRNYTRSETSVKLDKNDSINESGTDQSLLKSASNQPQCAAGDQTEEKVKAKKKKEKTSEVIVGTENKTEHEADVGNGESVATASKVVKKKKTKNVELTESPSVSSVISSPPAIIIQDIDTTDKSDMDADREVQSICGAQITDYTPELVVSGSADAQVIEVPETAEIDATNGNDGNDGSHLLSSIDEPSTDITSSTCADITNDTASVEKDLVASHGIDDNITHKNVEDKEFLAVSESQSTTTDATKSRDNEESDFSYRRKSMDDFIKRILAEAREEQQKRMSTMQPSSDEISSPVVNEMNTAIGFDVTNDLVSSAADKDRSMLDRRLASTDRRRIETSNSSDTLEELDKGKNIGLVSDLDLDDDLAKIKGYFSRRSKLDPSIDISDDLSSTETGYRSRVTRLDVGNSDDLVFTQKLLNDATPENGSSYLSRLRQQQETDAGESFGDTFSPRRREETSDVVRSSIRPVRAVIDQQTDIIQQLKTTSRSIDDLENEIRSLRETFHDRQARIESLRTAIDAERRIYDAEQTAANDRVQQQKLPGGHFVRDEFMASITSRLIPTGDQLFRPRSGSVSSSSGLSLSSLSAIGGSSEPVYQTRASSVKPSSVSGDTQRRQLGEDDDNSLTSSSYAAGRLRRGGSVARERTYTTEELLGGTSSSWNSRASTDYSTPTSYSSTSPWLSSYSSTTTPETSRYGSSQSSVGYGSYRYDPSDYKSPSSYSSSSLYTTDSSRTSSRVGLGVDRSYLPDSTSPSASTRYSSSTSTSSVDPLRFRRAQSVFDVSSENSYSNYDNSNNYASSPSNYASGSSEFQSKFLDKVRGKKVGGDDTQSGSSQFKSRFLRSTFDSSSKKY